MLTNPSCLLLDEPTSGLDSTSAVALVKLLQRLASAEQKTVIMSIHQPSSGMFLSFDNLLLMAEGNVVYYGTPHGSIQYLKERELACPEDHNVADHWMDLLVTDSSLEEEDEYARSSYFMNAQDSSDSQIRNRKGNVSLSREGIQASRRNTREQWIDAWDAQAMAEQIDNASAAFANTGATDLSLPVQKYNTSWTAQYRVLVHRALKNSRSAISTPLYRVYRTHTVRDRTANFFFTRTY